MSIETEIESILEDCELDDIRKQSQLSMAIIPCKQVYDSKD